MERRQAIKNLTGLAALAFTQHLYVLDQMKPIHVVGLGSAGTNVMNLFHSLGIGDIYTSISDYKGSKLPNGVHLSPYCPGLTPRDRVLQELYQPESIIPFHLPEDTKKLFRKDQRLVLLAGLGGYTATHMGKEIIPLFIEKGIDFKAVFCLPFKFEGTKKWKFAEELIIGVGQLAQVKYFDCEIIRKEWGNLTIRKAFEKVDQEMLKIYKSNQWKKL